MRETSDDGASTTSRKRKEPHREKDDYRDRDHRDRGHRYGHDDYDAPRTGRDRDYGYQREYRDREYSGGYGRSGKHKYERDDRRKDRRRDWEEPAYVREGEVKRERSVSVGYPEREVSSKRDGEERPDERGDKVRSELSRSWIGCSPCLRGLVTSDRRHLRSPTGYHRVRTLLKRERYKEQRPGWSLAWLRSVP